MKKRKIEIQADEQLIITVAQAPEPQPAPEPEPTPTPGSGESKLLYKAGLIADPHFDIEDSHNSEYKSDLQNALAMFANVGVSFIASTGDLCQYKDKDLIAFKEAYNGALPFFTCMGNHDYLRIYEKKDAAHPVPSSYKDFEDLWDKTVKSLAKGADVHYFGTSFKDKLNFWFERNGDIWLFTSVDYGASTERYDVIRAINRLDYDDAYVQMMERYVSDTQYDRTKEKNYDYRFYNPAVLIWVKNLFEANPKKRKFWQAHHFLPGKAGDTFDQYKHLRMWPVPTSAEILDKSYSGCNTVSGLTYWFFEKLLREHTNVILSDGHSHYAIGEQEDVTHRAYHMTQPTGNETTPLVESVSSLDGTKYDYQIYRTDGHSYADTAYAVHLPSLAKPDKRYGQTLYGASEGALMEVYDDKVLLKYIRFKSEGSGIYKNEVVKTVEIPIANDSSAVVDPDPKFYGTISFRILNATKQTVAFSGKLNLYTKPAGSADIYEDKYILPAILCAPDSDENGYPHWYKNPFVLKPGEEKVFTLPNPTVDYKGNGKKVEPVNVSLNTFVGNSFVSKDKTTDKGAVQIPAVKLGCAVYDKTKQETSNSAFIAHVVPVAQNVALDRTYNLVIDSVSANYKFLENDKDNRYVHV